MPERDGYAHGTPSWVDLGSPDPDASAAYYAELFGWEAGEPGPPETGGYRMFMQDGRMVAGLGPLMSTDQPPAWMTYVAVDDADAVAAKVTEAGGQTLFDPMDIVDAGRMAIFMDTVGAVFGVWQSGVHKGAQLVNEPVSLCWNELFCRDPAGAQTFYGAVLGWDAAAMPEQPGYTIWTLGDSGVGAMREMAEFFPPEVPAHWGVCFAVADADAATARNRELGGQVHREPWDIPPVGRVAALADPHGASFAVIALAAPPG